MYRILLTTHATLAAISIAGFLLRGYFRLRDPDRLSGPVVRIAPHAVDTLFLASGIALVGILDLDVLRSGWLLAKLAGLIVYVALGMVAFRYARTPPSRLIAFAAAIATYAYIVGVALAKSPASWIAWFAA